jgi:hypothetical protein
MSARMVCPATRKNGPVVPPRIQRAPNPAMLGATAHPIEHRHRTRLATRYVDLLPIIVLIGSQIRPDKAWATKTPALTVLMVVTPMSKSEATSGVAGIIAVLQNVIGRGIQQTTNRMTHFLQDGISATSSSMAPTGGRGVTDGWAPVNPPDLGSLAILAEIQGTNKMY